MLLQNSEQVHLRIAKSRKLCHPIPGYQPETSLKYHYLKLENSCRQKLYDQHHEMQIFMNLLEENYAKLFAKLHDIDTIARLLHDWQRSHKRECWKSFPCPFFNNDWKQNTCFLFYENDIGLIKTVPHPLSSCDPELGFHPHHHMSSRCQTRFFYGQCLNPPHAHIQGGEYCMFLVKMAFVSMMIGTTSITSKSRTKWIWSNPWTETVGWLIPRVQRWTLLGELTFFWKVFAAPQSDREEFQFDRLFQWSYPMVRFLVNSQTKPRHNAMLSACWYISK